ncbi:MAG: phage tail tip lysozyme [Candidatus Saccharimonadales bacterium]
MTILILATLSKPVLAINQNDMDSFDTDSTFYDPNSGSCGASANTDTSTVGGSNAAQTAFNYFISQGLPPFQAAGIIGNMQAESGVQPQRLQNTTSGVVTPAQSLSPSQLTNANLGWGLVQWTPPGKMITPTKQVGKDANDILVQLDFLWAQLTTGSEKGAGAALKATTTVEDAAVAFLTKYERPSSKALASSKAFRISAAEQILKQYGNGAPSGISSANAGCQVAPTSNGAGGYKNPFRDIKQSVPNRIDQGVDWDGAGPVYAIGNATVDGIFYNFYAGLPYIAYTLTDGPAAGKTVYFSECISVASGIAKGVTVTPDTVIATMNAASGSPCHSGTEIGWANASRLPDPMAHPVYSEGHATAYGLNMSKLLQSLGLPSGTYDHASDRGHELGTLAPGWPTW